MSRLLTKHVTLAALAALALAASVSCATSKRAWRSSLPPWVFEKLAPHLSRDDVQVTLHTTHYAVEGNSYDAINTELAKHGPDLGNWAVGSCRWQVLPQWRIEQAAGACLLHELRVDVKIDITMPRWQDTGNKLIKKRWARFYRQLQKHEHGHARVGVHAGEEVFDALTALSSTTDCERLSREAERRYTRIIAAHHAIDDEYDRASQHGGRQGVRFP